jgi:hypothetical protein
LVFRSGMNPVCKVSLKARVSRNWPGPNSGACNDAARQNLAGASDAAVAGQ